MRKERIERLLYELQYEVTRGIMEREIEEDLTFRFMIPTSRAIPGGFVGAEFRTRPYTAYDGFTFGLREAPKLRLVGGKDGE